MSEAGRRSVRFSVGLGIKGGSMSIDEFNSTRWGPRMFAIYKGEKYPIAAMKRMKNDVSV